MDSRFYAHTIMPAIGCVRVHKAHHITHELENVSGWSDHGAANVRVPAPGSGNPGYRWIPACAGMTDACAGMTS
jgi:hypothetical protein